MLAGTKPLAAFSELIRAEFEWPDRQFEPYVLSGTLLKREFLHEGMIAGQSEQIRYLYFSLPDEAWRIEAAHQNRLRTQHAGRETDEDAREMGLLLGYSEEEISVFLAWSNKVREMVRTGVLDPVRT